jgi:drug/metabolite transporter (DMT)-like permease
MGLLYGGHEESEIGRASCRRDCRGQVVKRFLPVYFFVSRARLLEASWQDIALQAFAHGVLTAVVSLLLFGRAVSLLGASNGSAFAALCPVITALAAIPVLGELPTTGDWIAMLLISSGVYFASGGPLPARWAGSD